MKNWNWKFIVFWAVYMIILILCAILLAGCIGKSLTRYDPISGRKTLEITDMRAMVNSHIGGLILSVKDANFVATLIVIDSNVTDSPESATAIGDAVTSVMTGGASNIIK